VLPPMKRVSDQWYQGTADAVYQNIYSIGSEQPRHVLILSGDHNITNGTPVRNGLLELTTGNPAGWTAEMHNKVGNIGLADGSVQPVSIAVRSWHRDLAALAEDFVLFDPGIPGQAVVYMRYDAAGHLTGLDFSDDAAEVARARRRRDIALAHAVPLSEFTALAEAG